jgi:hypothetical protein
LVLCFSILFIAPYGKEKTILALIMIIPILNIYVIWKNLFSKIYKLKKHVEILELEKKIESLSK